jgi:SAM-dependent MidA family methyltransferase
VLDLPAPSQQALELSAELAVIIRREIDSSGGSIPFSRYMELCLYTPGLGYYSAGQRKFGSGGDFVTAPEISPLFGHCLANSCKEVLESLQGGDILEFGAGSGQLAIDVLGELERLACLPGRYLILERSAELRQRQQQAIQNQLPHLLDRVVWIDALPTAGFRGVMLANEVLDAMAVERFQWDGKAARLFHVSCDGDGFHWHLQRHRDTATAAVESRGSASQSIARGPVTLAIRARTNPAHSRHTRPSSCVHDLATPCPSLPRRKPRRREAQWKGSATADWP